VAWLIVAPLATWILRALFLKFLARLPLPRVEQPPAP
jgi:branched-subunit amino acid transport protein